MTTSPSARSGSQGIDPDLTDLPLEAVTDAAFTRAATAGSAETLVRIHRARTAHHGVHDGVIESASESLDVGMSVRVLHQGAWGFAACESIDPSAMSGLVDQAIALAALSGPLMAEPERPALEPSYGERTWMSPYDIDPFSVTSAERSQLLIDRSMQLLRHPGVTHADADVELVKESTYVADSGGSRITQQRVRVGPSVTAVAVDGDGFESLRTLAPPAARGWEYLLGQGWDWNAELDELPELLAEKMRAPGVEPGCHDLVIDATNLWLTIHESIGHATELDRIFGYEANYAGTSFVPADGVGSLRYGSPGMRITADRIVPYGLATTGWDDENVMTQEWDLVNRGVLTGFQLDRATASRGGFARSNGCAYAESGTMVPMQRMANVSLQPDPTGPTLEGLLAAMGDGLLVMGDNSWSIDMQRYNFQFTGQRFHRVRNGRIVGQVRDAAYQGRTPDFWAAMALVGGPSTYRLMGALNCGKGQPGQAAPVSHGTPAALFRDVNVLNTAKEA